MTGVEAKVLSSSERTRIATVVRKVVGDRSPGAFTATTTGPEFVEEKLELLVDIARRTVHRHEESCLAQMIDNVCSGCLRQFPSRFCPMRAVSCCVLVSNALAVIEAVAGELREIADPEYLRNHPDEAV